MKSIKLTVTDFECQSVRPISLNEEISKTIGNLRIICKKLSVSLILIKIHALEGGQNHIIIITAMTGKGLTNLYLSVLRLRVFLYNRQLAVAFQCSGRRHD